MKKITPEIKKLVQDLSEKGFNANDVRKTLKGYARQQIAAIMAWKTMATDKKALNGEPVPFKNAKSVVKKLDKKAMAEWEGYCKRNSGAKKSFVPWKNWLKDSTNKTPCKSKTRKMSELDRGKVIKMVKKGMTTEQIQGKIAYSRQQIAAVRAWVTMGKY